MYAILAEDVTDARTLRVLVHRLCGPPTPPVAIEGFEGCGNLLRKGARRLEYHREQGRRRFIVCIDADGPDPRPRRDDLFARVLRPSRVADAAVAVVPVQELEAWLLADLSAVRHVITGWRPADVTSPETIASPKEHLRRLSRGANARPRYVPTQHNERLAEYVDLSKVSRACPSFRPLAAFVTSAA